jgi:hypothetical protein
MSSRLLTGLLFLAATVSLGQEGSSPAVAGHITRLASPTDFDVNGEHILLTGETAVLTERVEQASKDQAHKDKDEAYTVLPLQDAHLYLGQPVEVYGKLDQKTHGVTATRIMVHLRKPHEVSGFGILDAVLPLPSNAASPSDRLVRADGYSVLISTDTKMTFDKPLSSASDIQVNVWMTFHGKQRLDGIVAADRINFSKNVVSRGEDKLRERTEYDPAAVDQDKKQSAISKGFIGIDPKQIPPYKDAAMQARVSAIGAKLVPKYQFDFPYTEETRIDFRFQVIDSTKWRDAMTLPNGIILVPRQVVERMQNDSQLATVLADNIACALEKQPLNGHQQANEFTAANLAGDAAGIIVPGLGLATSIATGTTAMKLERLRREQSGRVSLALLHDSGYDITQAPVAWWLLAPKKPKEVADIPLPARAAYLYKFLGETWTAN